MFSLYTCYILFAIIIYVLCKFYHCIMTRKLVTFKSNERMDGKVVIFTGANSNIGKEVTRDLARRGAKIIMACQGLGKAYDIQREIQNEFKNTKILIRKLDISSQTSIHQFVNFIVSTEEVVDVLILNSDTSPKWSKKLSSDSIEMTYAANYFGPFLLTHLLIDLLKKSKQGRIIAVSPKLDNFKDQIDVNPKDCFFTRYLYGKSIFAYNMFILELAKRLKSTNVTANIVNLWAFWAKQSNFLKNFFQSSIETAKIITYLAVSKDVMKISGHVFDKCTIPVHRQISNEEFDLKLWEKTKEIVNLTLKDPQI